MKSSNSTRLSPPGPQADAPSSACGTFSPAAAGAKALEGNSVDAPIHRNDSCRRTATIASILALLALPLAAQTTVVYQNDFQAVAAKNPI